MANKKTSDYIVLPGGVPNDAWLLDIANAGVLNYKGTSLEFKDYVNAGKSGGKTIEGGTAAAEDLIFHTTADASKGNYQFTELNVVNGIVQTDGSGNLISSITLADGTIATTQSPLDNSTKLATTAYVDTAVTVEDIWDRTGTTITVKNAGDDIDFSTAGLLQTATFDSTNISAYDSHPTFTLDEQIIDKKYADDLVAAAGVVTKDLTTQLAAGGVTSFTLDTTPAVPSIASLFYNGNRQFYGVNFTISGTTLTWMPGVAPLFALGAAATNNLWIEYEKIITPVTNRIPFKLGVSGTIPNETGDLTSYTIAYNSVETDPSSLWDVVNNQIIIPSDGVVENVNSTISISKVASTHGVIDYRIVQRNSGGTIIDERTGFFGNASSIREVSSPTEGQIKLTINGQLDVSTGDTLETILKVGTSTKNIIIQPQTSFSGVFTPDL